MKLTDNQISLIENFITMYENGTSLQRMAREVGILTSTGHSTVSSFFSVLRKVGIDPVRRTDGYMVRMSDEERSQYEKWLFTQRHI